MYLVLVKDDFLNMLNKNSPWKTYFMDCLEEVYNLVNRFGGGRVYSLDSLTEIVEIKATFEEITKETETEKE